MKRRDASLPKDGKRKKQNLDRQSLSSVLPNRGNRTASKNTKEVTDSDEEVIFDSSEESEFNGDSKQTISSVQEDSSSDEEWHDEKKNRVGNISMEVYKDFNHIGYNILGKKLPRPEKERSQMESFLERHDNPDFWYTVFDAQNQRTVVLSREERDLITSLVHGNFPKGYDPYEPFIDLDYKDSIHPVTGMLPKKSSFLPSKWEAKKIKKLVYAIRQGWIKLDSIQPHKQHPIKHFYDIWEKETDNKELAYPKRLQLPKPMLYLPGHAESYNVPEEYLFSEEELTRWHQSADPKNRKLNFIPAKYRYMRSIPSYKRLQKDHFERCLRLFLAPREHRNESSRKVPELPKLPDPSTLRPYPNRQTMLYKGHTDKVRSISFDPQGQWIASASEDCTMRIWELDTGRCFKKWSFQEIVYSVVWNPNPNRNLLAVSAGNILYFIDPGTQEPSQTENIRQLFESSTTNNLISATETENTKEEESQEENQKRRQYGSQWEKKMSAEERKLGILIKIPQQKTVKELSWHSKGDYLISLSFGADQNGILVIHQLSTQRSQSPFRSQKGKVQLAKFHPTKPLLFIATQIEIKIYNLSTFQLEKKLKPSVRWISSFDIHPGGDNVIVSSYDRKVCWFDLDLSSSPYKVLRYHRLAVRKVVFHKNFPLFASCSDDLTVQIFHGKVFDDLNLNPEIVPLQILRGHRLADELGVLDCKFHPIQPWLVTAGADSTIRLFTAVHI